MIWKKKQAENYGQDTKFAIIEVLLPFLKNKNFIDVGAERGSFVRFLTHHDLVGALFEPLPKYARTLKKIAQSTQCQFFSYAIDKTDQTNAEFYIATDSKGEVLDYFHSLHPINNDTRINHRNSIYVDCRSLNSLYHEGVIQKEIGILKTDTEGNDLHVLLGANELDIEIIICEFYTSGLYSGWDQGNPYCLIEEAKKLGFNHYFAIKKLDHFELVSTDQANFINLQWGSLIFVNDDIFEKSQNIINQFSANKENALLRTFKNRLDDVEKESIILRKVCDERLELIEKLHLEFENNRYLNTKRLVRAVNLFLSEFNAFYDQIHAQSRSIGNNENDPSDIVNLVKDKMSVLQNKYATINKEKMRILEYQQQVVGQFKDGTVSGHTRYLKGRIRMAITPKLGNLLHYPPRTLEIPKRYYKKRVSKKYPMISIVTPTFKQGTFLERTIKSIIDQKYPHLEYIVQDGGCDQSTIDILKKYQSSLKYWESVQDSGQSHALNLGFRHTTGEIMAYLNSDDLLLPGSLHYIGQFFEKHPDVDVIYGHRILINENDEEIGRWILPPHDSEILSWADYIPQETLFWRRRVWNMIGAKIDESFRFAMDWDLILRFREVGANFVRLPRFIGAFRIHPHQKTSAHLSKTGTDEMNRLRERCHGRKTSVHEIKSNIRTYLYKHLLCHRLYRLGILQY